MEAEFYIDRSSSVQISDDTKNIVSECHEITFYNDGEWPVYIEIVGTDCRYYLDQYMGRSFGTDRTNVQERTKFNVTFDPAGSGTKRVNVERVRFVSLKAKNC